jgi:Zn-dependent protease
VVERLETQTKDDDVSQHTAGRRQPPGPGPRDTPFGTGIPVGRWVGVPIRAHWSVLIVLVLFTGVIASVDLPRTRPGASTGAYWATGAVTALALLLALLAHELAHAVVARRYGLRVRRITLWMLGGLTELEGEAPTPRADALNAAAGPLASLGLGVVCGAAARLVGGTGLVVSALGWLAAMNVLLGVFNLLPGAPLDGGRLVRALLWWHSHDRTRAADQAARAGRALGTTLVGLGLFLLVLGDYGGGWLALVGWFVLNGAASEQYAVRAERLHDLTVRDAMTPTPFVAPAWWTVEQFVTRLSPDAARQPVFPLVDLDGRLDGTLTLAALDQVPAERRAGTRVHDLAAPTGKLLQAAPGDDLAHLLLPLHLRGGMAVVVDDGRPVGVITDADLARASRLARTGWAGGGDPPTTDRAAS